MACNVRRAVIPGAVGGGGHGFHLSCLPSLIYCPLLLLSGGSIGIGSDTVRERP
jgi:hypothetical protein